MSKDGSGGSGGLEQDLLNNAYDRLIQWEQDTADRMEAVAIPLRRIAFGMVNVLVWELCRVVTILELEPRNLHGAIDEALNSEQVTRFKRGRQGRGKPAGASNEGGR
jgi:hypothetical protein